MRVAAAQVYVDGEAEPSLMYEPAKASGVGSITGPNSAAPSSQQPWSTKWFGQLGRSSYFNTFRVPFQKSVRVTYQCPPTLCHDAAQRYMLFVQARGVSGLGDGLTDIISGLVNLPGHMFWANYPSHAPLPPPSCSVREQTNPRFANAVPWSLRWKGCLCVRYLEC